MHTLTIGAIASRKAIAVDPETPVREALASMFARRISCLAVVFRETPVGILTERDIVQAADKVLGFACLQVREIMTSPVLTVREDRTVADAYRLLRADGVRHLLVIDRDYDLAGVVTQSDLIHKLPASHFAAADLSTLMTREVKTVAPETAARTGLKTMAEHAISCVVVAENRRPVGLFTERDVTALLARSAPEADLWSTPLSEVMSRPALALPAATPPARALALMREKALRRLLVIDGAGDLAGIATQSDFSRFLCRELTREADEAAQKAIQSVLNSLPRG